MKKTLNYPIFILLTGLIFFTAQCGKKSGSNPPSISSVDPTGGLPGDPVTIHGTDMTGATSVSFNSITSTVITATSTSVTTVVPMSATKGTYNVSVTTPSGTSGNFAFTVYEQPPYEDNDPPQFAKTIPQSNYSDYPLLISGNNFSGVYSVKFGDKDAVISTSNHTCITTVVPKDLPAGNVTVTIYTNKKPTATFQFQVLGAAPTGNVPVNFSVVTIPPPNYVPSISNSWGSPCNLFEGNPDSTFDVVENGVGTLLGSGKFSYHFNSTLGYNDLNYVQFTYTSSGETYAGMFTSKTVNPCILKMIVISSKTGKVDSCLFDRLFYDSTVICDP